MGALTKPCLARLCEHQQRSAWPGDASLKLQLNLPPTFTRARRAIEPGDELRTITSAYAGRANDAAQLWLDAQLMLLHSNTNAQRLLQANASVLCLSQVRLHGSQKVGPCMNESLPVWA
jgi:hypothetical protein